MHSFNYHRPENLGDAAQWLAQAEDAKLVAGGMTLIPTMKQRLASPSDLVDLAGIADLKGISDQGDSIVIGAMTTHAAVAADSAVKTKIPALAGLAEGIGDPQVRNRGTLGGSIANSDPAADYPAARVALGAPVRTDKREISAEDFFTGLFETDLEETEIVTAVVFPLPDLAAYVKFANPASRYAIVGVFVARGAAGIRVAVTGAGPCVFRARELEQALAADFSAKALEGIEVSAEDLNSDIHASAEYRANLITVMAKRAVTACR